MKLLAFLSPSDPRSLESFTRFSMDFSLCTDPTALYWLLSGEASISSSRIKSAIVLYNRFGSFHMSHFLFQIPAWGQKGRVEGKKSLGGVRGRHSFHSIGHLYTSSWGVQNCHLNLTQKGNCKTTFRTQDIIKVGIL